MALLPSVRAVQRRLPSSREGPSQPFRVSCSCGVLIFHWHENLETCLTYGRKEYTLLGPGLSEGAAVEKLSNIRLNFGEFNPYRVKTHTYTIKILSITFFSKNFSHVILRESSRNSRFFQGFLKKNPQRIVKKIPQEL